MSPLQKSQSVSTTAPERTWSRFQYPQSLIKYGGYLLILAFVIFSMEYLNVHVGRFFGMFGRFGDLIVNRYFPPEISYVMAPDYLSSVLETVQMAFLGAIFGILLSVPLSWFASFNIL